MTFPHPLQWRYAPQLEKHWVDFPKLLLDCSACDCGIMHKGSSQS